MNGWIDVKDEMPAHGKKGLATYRNCLDNSRTIVARYIERWKEETNGEDDCYHEYCETKDAYFSCEGWYEQIDNWAEYSSVCVNEGGITYWMPLPESPTN